MRTARVGSERQTQISVGPRPFSDEIMKRLGNHMRTRIGARGTPPPVRHFTGSKEPYRGMVSVRRAAVCAEAEKLIQTLGEQAYEWVCAQIQEALKRRDLHGGAILAAVAAEIALRTDSRPNIPRVAYRRAEAFRKAI